MKEVFISRRLNRWGRRFGFVILFDVENEGRLERELGNMKLHVNIPKYRRDVAEQKAGRHREVSKQNAFILDNLKNSFKEDKKPYEHGVRQGGTKGRWYGEKRKGRRSEGCTKGQSYAEEVRRLAKEQWKGPVIDTQHQVLPWMVNSVVRHLSPDVNYDQLCDEVVKEGLNMIKVRFLGDNLVLLTPKGGERMDDLIKHNKEWFESFLKIIDPWSESLVVDHKIVWVRCYELSLSHWNKDCLSKVVEEFGSLVFVDEIMETWEILEYARVQVQMLKSCNARVTKRFKINGIDYNIYIEEENPSNEGRSCKCNYNRYA